MKVILLVLSVLSVALAASVNLREIAPPRNAFIKPVFTPSEEKPALGIINGVEARPHSVPSQAYIIVISLSGQRWSCGGTLITSRFVLTAAHCLVGGSVAEVHLGVHDLRQFELGSLSINSTNLIVHELYNDEFIDNDIGLIQLDGQIFPSQTIDYARLPSRREGPIDLVERSGKVTGWGIKDGVLETISYVLMQTNDTVIPNLQCNSIFGVVRDEEICTSGAGGNGACRGDTGGPLVIGNTQEGIISYGNPYCVPMYPTVFVRIRSFLNWIETHSDWRDQ